MKPIIFAAAIALAATSTTNAQTIQVLSATVKDQRIQGAEVLMQRNGEQSQSTMVRCDANAIAAWEAKFFQHSEGYLYASL